MHSPTPQTPPALLRTDAASPSRTELVALARRGSADAALPGLLALLRQSPADSELRHHAAACLIRLGLGRPAQAVIAPLAPSPITSQLRAAAQQCDNKLLLPDQFALAARIAKLAAAMPELNGAAVAEIAAQLAGEGEYVGAPGQTWRWKPATFELRPLGIVGAAAADIGALTRSTSWAYLCTPTYPVLAAAAALPNPLPPRWGPGYRRRVHIIVPHCASPEQAAAELALLDSPGSAQGSVLDATAGQLQLWCGADAVKNLAHWLAEHDDVQLDGLLSRCDWAAASELQPDMARALAGVIHDAIACQQVETARLARVLGCTGYADAAAPPNVVPYTARAGTASDRPMRLLVVTARFSTFMKHAALDLVQGAVAAGHEATLLIERDDFSNNAPLALLRAQKRLQPDAIVRINFTRMAGDFVSPHTPVVTWIQDAMGHLFDPDASRFVAKGDIIAGHLYPQLFEQYGFPAERLIACPVLVNPVKFQPLARASRSEHFCDVAYVSHQSETPAQLCQRLVVDATGHGDLPLARAIPRIFSLLHVAMSECQFRPLSVAACRIVQQVVTEHALSDRPGIVDKLQCMVAWPMLERMLRHRMLDWAAQLTTEHGLSLRIYGQGWHTHPTLCNFAAGPLHHGRPLAESYANAGVHLHASVGTWLHQRVMECACAGGVPLVYRKRDDFLALEQHINLMLTQQAAAPTATELLPDRGRLWLHIADHPLTLAFAAHCQRLGTDLNFHQPAMFHLRPDRATSVWRAKAGNLRADGAEMLGDWSLTTFASKADLERSLRMILGSPSLRTNVSQAIAARVRRSFSHQWLAEQIVEQLRTPLSCAANTAAPAILTPGAVLAAA